MSKSESCNANKFKSGMNDHEMTSFSLDYEAVFILGKVR